MIDQRTIGYMGLVFILFLIYDAWQKDYAPKQPETTLTEQTTNATSPTFPELPEIEVGSEINTDSQVINATSPSPTAATTFDDGSNQQTITSLAKTITLETDVLRLEVDTKGGSVVKAELLAYPIERDQPDVPVRLLSPDIDTYYVAQSGLASQDQAAPGLYGQYQSSQNYYQLSEGADELQVPLYWEDASGIKVTKIFTLKRGEYAIKIDHQLDNNSNTNWLGVQRRQLQRVHQDDGNSFFIYTYTGGVIYSKEKHYEKVDFEEMAKKPLNRNIQGGWAAIIQHYFLSAWVPDENESNVFLSQGVNTSSGYRYVLAMQSPAYQVAPLQSKQFSNTLYVGPKLQQQLSSIATGLELTADYGLLTIISQPLYWLLNKVNGLVNNWGWSIIIVTLLIKLIFYKLAETSYRSMANMRKVQPKMLAIRERYAEDRQRQGQAMMELYKKEKINPVAGCLPMLIQIPVFIALYWVLLETVELRQAPFILWIQDLSSKDPFYVLPLIMGVTMYIQFKLNPAPPDPIQAKVFATMPFIFTIFFAFFPAGLVLYWVVNNVLTIAQQWYITRRVLAEDKK